MRISLRQLEILEDFSKTLNATRTAQRMHVSQSAVSHALHELEDKLGLKLFQRDGNRMQLSTSGAALLPSVRGILGQLEGLMIQAEILRDAGREDLTIATLNPLTPWLVNAAAARSVAKRPELHFMLSSYREREVPARVRGRAADIGFGFCGDGETPQDFLPLMRADIVCALPEDHPLAAQPTVRVEDLAGERLIVPDRDTYVGGTLHRALPQGMLAPGRMLEVNLSVVSLDLVRQRLGIALQHPFGVPRGAPGLALRPLEPRLPVRLGMFVPGARSGLAHISAFADAIREVVIETVAEGSRAGDLVSTVAMDFAPAETPRLQ